MARYNLFIVLFFLAFSCSPVQLTQDLTRRETKKLYHQAIHNVDRYFLHYNNDSSFVICIVNDTSYMISEPVSFAVINLIKKEKVFVSLNEYHRAGWIDSDQVLLTRYIGMPFFDRTIHGKTGNNRIEYILNVRTNELHQKQKMDENVY